LLYYSNTPPPSPPDLAAMTMVPMQLESGDMSSGRWMARVPNPVAGQSPGASRSLYYVVVASDDDDSAGSCDHVTQVPDPGAFQMTVTNPGGEGGAAVCEPCTHDVQCGGSGDLCVRVGTGSDAYCLKSCTSDSDCPSNYACTAAAVQSVEGRSGRQCAPRSSDCSDPAGEVCIDDSREDNDNLQQALAGPRLGKGTHDLVSCPAQNGTGDDEDYFTIDVFVDTQLTLRLIGGGQTDVDLALYTEEGVLVASSLSVTSTEQIVRCLTPGLYVARVFAWGTPLANPYQLTVGRDPMSCSATCEADENEDDDGPAQARVVDILPSPYLSTTQSICSGDDDWYEVDVYTGERLIVDLTFEQTSSTEDLDIHLYSSSGTTDLTPCSPTQTSTCQFDNGQSVTSNEHFEWQTPSGCEPCFRYVVVRGFGGSENLYDISIGVQ
jgi:hypothetical protein